MNRLRMRRQYGVGLIEVLVALLVLAIGVLGYAGMQLTALKAAEDSNNRAQATLLAQDALERFLANEAGIDTYTEGGNWPDQTMTPGEKPKGLNDCITQTCTADEMATWDIAMLSWQAANLLQGGMVAVSACKAGSPLSCVAVSWGDQKASDCFGDGGINTDEGTACVVLEVSR